MSNNAEADRLREEIREREQRLDEIEVPQTPDQARELARTDPAAFDRLADARKIPAAALGAAPRES